MLVIGTRIDEESGCGLAADGVVRKHALNGKLHCKLGALGHDLLVLSGLPSSDVSGVTAVEFLFRFLTGAARLLTIADDNKFTAVGLSGELGTVFPAEYVSGNNSCTSEGFARGVQHIALALNGLGFRHIGGH